MLVRLDSGAACGAEAPRLGKVSAAFWTMVGHGKALPVGVNNSTTETDENRTGITGQGTATRNPERNDLRRLDAV